MTSGEFAAILREFRAAQEIVAREVATLRPFAVARAGRHSPVQSPQFGARCRSW